MFLYASGNCLLVLPGDRKLEFADEGERAVLIYNPKSKQYKAVPQSEFPIGIIYDGCNYYCQPTAACDEFEIIRHTPP